MAWRIREVARAVGLDLDDAAEAAIATWLDTLAVWNARMDLTAARTTDEIAELMLADGFVVAKRLPVGASMVDVGSGAGAPGMAIALARPDLRVTLVEPLAKRVSFLRTVTGLVRRTDVTVVASRGEDVAPESFDVAISRATLEPASWLALGTTLVRVGGSVWVLLASHPGALAPTERPTEQIDYELPFSRKGRTSARFERA